MLAQKMLVDLHNSLKISDFIDVNIKNYYGRNIKVIFADKISKETAKRLKGSPLENYPLIGTLSEVANFSILSDDPKYQENVKSIYANGATRP